MRRTVRPSELVVRTCLVCFDSLTIPISEPAFCGPICKITHSVLNSPKEKGTKKFYRTFKWRMLRKAVIAKYGNRCMKCKQKCVGRNLHVDHIKPRALFPELSLIFSNLQVLCKFCNLSKGKSVADYRE